LCASSAIAGIFHHVKEAAPELGVSELLQAPAGAKADWKSLRGKVVVVEFWATWCGNCIRQIPRLNELTEQMKNDSVVFISVTDEDRATIEPFLKTHPMRGWVAVSAPASTIAAYDAEGRPITYVVGPDGMIDAKLDPGFESKFPIQPQNLRNLLAGKPSGLVTTPRLGYAGQVVDAEGAPVEGVAIFARKRRSPTDWTQIGGGVTTDRQGRFAFDAEIPTSWVNEFPVSIEFNHPRFLFARLEDLRLLPAEQLANLRITLQDGNAISGRLLNADGQPAAHARTRIAFDAQPDYAKDCETDAQGGFDLRGLPTLKGELRALLAESPNQLLSFRQEIDPRSGQTAPFQMHRVLPGSAKAVHMLGMTIVSATGDIQKEVFSAQPGILVIDPGTRNWLGIGVLHTGDCICATRGQEPIADVQSFARLLLDAHARAEPKKRAWISGSVQSFYFGVVNGGPQFPFSLTESDLAELRAIAGQP